MSTKPLFCFIDDAQFELDNFQSNAAKAFKGAEFIYAATFEQAQAQLGQRLPLCFLLDIYGADPQLDTPRLPETEILSDALGNTPSQTDLYGGIEVLDTCSPEKGNLFLRRLYGGVENWQSAFQTACQCLGQGSAYGLHNLAQARAHYPWAAALGYSRKALYDDAVEMMRAGADGLLRKPQGADEAAIAKATKSASPDLALAAFSAVDRRLASMASTLGLNLCLDGDHLSLAEAILEGVRHLHPSLAGEPSGSKKDAVQALKALRLEDAGLSQDAVSLLVAFKRWLGRE
jgi:DNA-binding NarL/FixJ family response regulator